jgi:hypothetical protein
LLPEERKDSYRVMLAALGPAGISSPILASYLRRHQVGTLPVRGLIVSVVGAGIVAVSLWILRRARSVKLLESKRRSIPFVAIWIGACMGLTTMAVEWIG